MSRRNSVPLAEYEELFNLVRNTCKMQSQSEVMASIGLTDSAPSSWKRKGKVPFYVICALKGVLSECQSEGSEPKVSVGMRFTTEQLELLNAAAAAYSKVINDLDLRKVRSAIHLELAARLDGGR